MKHSVLVIAAAALSFAQAVAAQDDAAARRDARLDLQDARMNAQDVTEFRILQQLRLQGLAEAPPPDRVQWKAALGMATSSAEKGEGSSEKAGPEGTCYSAAAHA